MMNKLMWWRIDARLGAFETATLRRPSPNALLATPSPKKVKSQNITVNMNIDI
jgi:hypothetical protein